MNLVHRAGHRVVIVTITLQGDLASYPSDSPMQQEAVWAVAATDAYQWGYDPVHYGVPEGSYSTDPDGPARILEYRCPRDTHSFCFMCALHPCGAHLY
jgi:hypothetical protein